jgi:hypothetical protein
MESRDEITLIMKKEDWEKRWQILAQARGSGEIARRRGFFEEEDIGEGRLSIKSRIIKCIDVFHHGTMEINEKIGGHWLINIPKREIQGITVQ